MRRRHREQEEQAEETSTTKGVACSSRRRLPILLPTMKETMIVAAGFCYLMAMLPVASGFAPLSRRISLSPSRPSGSSSSTQLRSDWSDFASLDDLDEDDDDEILSDNLMRKAFADENDSQEYKAEVGSSLEPPELDWDGDPIEVPQGTALPLEPETIQGLLAACRNEIGTMFGYSAENRGVGITGGVDFVELDGPIVVLRLKGRFWHQRTTVLDRVAAYLIGRCPEIVDVVVEDEWQLTDEANDAA